MYMQLFTTVAFQQPPDGKIILIQSNQENSKHQKYFRNVIVLQEKSQSGMKKLTTSSNGNWLFISLWFCGQFRCPGLRCDWS